MRFANKELICLDWLINVLPKKKPHTGLKLPEHQKIPEFYRFWTRKEAFVKATGHGIALGLNHCVINPENPTEFLRVPENCGQASAWHVLDIDLGAGVCSALVADKEIAEVRLMDLELVSTNL